MIKSCSIFQSKRQETVIPRSPTRSEKLRYKEIAKKKTENKAKTGAKNKIVSWNLKTKIQGEWST